MATGWTEVAGLEVEEAADGQATVRMRAGPQHLNQGGSVHGGALATLMDTAMGGAVYSTAEPGDDATRTATIEMKVTYLEPAQPGEVVARAHVIKRGKRVTIVEAEATQGDDMVAHAISTFTSPS